MPPWEDASLFNSTARTGSYVKRRVEEDHHLVSKSQVLKYQLHVYFITI